MIKKLKTTIGNCVSETENDISNANRASKVDQLFVVAEEHDVVLNSQVGNIKYTANERLEPKVNDDSVVPGLMIWG